MTHSKQNLVRTALLEKLQSAKTENVLYKLMTDACNSGERDLVVEQVHHKLCAITFRNNTDKFHAHRNFMHISGCTMEESGSSPFLNTIIQMVRDEEYTEYVGNHWQLLLFFEDDIDWCPYDFIRSEIFADWVDFEEVPRRKIQLLNEIESHYIKKKENIERVLKVLSEKSESQELLYAIAMHKFSNDEIGGRALKRRSEIAA